VWVLFSFNIDIPPPTDQSCPDIIFGKATVKEEAFSGVSPCTRGAAPGERVRSINIYQPVAI